MRISVEYQLNRKQFCEFSLLRLANPPVLFRLAIIHAVF